MYARTHSLRFTYLLQKAKKKKGIQNVKCTEKVTPAAVLSNSLKICKAFVGPTVWWVERCHCTGGKGYRARNIKRVNGMKK